ncbi:MAG TPA: DUF1697 domain-containing protein, partial [Ignavibacteria bacterium]|nr:DUF1697 domain-containing protein [Ignavibacteria bacterium]HMR42012.1 DUF1697 domain-containing protein [Ignavibacteria bacterium]
MKTYIAILRGINVGGYRIIRMNELRQLLEKLDFVNVQTYVQSGNIVFQFAQTDLQVPGMKITDAITKRFGFYVPVILSGSDEFKKIIDANPFSGDRSKDSALMHLTFLSENPDPENIEIIMRGDYHRDELVIIGKAVYLYCPDKYCNSRLSNGFFEDK